MLIRKITIIMSGLLWFSVPATPPSSDESEIYFFYCRTCREEISGRIFWQPSVSTILVSNRWFTSQFQRTERLFAFESRCLGINGGSARKPGNGSEWPQTMFAASEGDPNLTEISREWQLQSGESGENAPKGAPARLSSFPKLLSSQPQPTHTLSERLKSKTMLFYLPNLLKSFKKCLKSTQKYSKSSKISSNHLKTV